MTPGYYLTWVQERGYQYQIIDCHQTRPTASLATSQGCPRQIVRYNDLTYDAIWN